MSVERDPAFGREVGYKYPQAAWLAQTVEEIIEPQRPIIDPHHHLWDRDDSTYLLPQILEDVRSGHNIRGTVFIECSAMFRQRGPLAMAAVGETEFVNGVAAMSASGRYGPCRVAAGIVAFADLTLGAAVGEVLDAHARAASDRFVGIRQITCWDPDVTVRIAQAAPKPAPAPGMMSDAKFREGFAQLAPRGLVYDAWIFHPQIGELADLARAFPDTTIVVDHIGGAMKVGAYKGRSDEVYRLWLAAMRELSELPNVVVKLGGVGMKMTGFGYHARATPPGSQELARDWRPWFEPLIERFGTRRCMFETNFPVDKQSFSYAVNWNAFKRLAAGASEEDKHRLFYGTAEAVYRLSDLVSAVDD